MRTKPWIFAQLQLAQYPATLGTMRLRWSKRPESLPGEFYEPRIISIGEITRASTDEDGNWISGGCTIEVSDDDGYISTLLDEGTSTEFWSQREFDIWIISDEGVTAGITPDTMVPTFRGFISDVQCEQRVATLEVTGLLGSQMSGFNLDKKCLKYRIRDLNPDAPEDNLDIALRVLVGEFSTNGWTNSFGQNAEKGLVPAHEVGEIDITDTSAPAVPTYAIPPVITASSQHGGGSGVTRFYAATVITPYGESTISNVVSINGAGALSLANYDEVSGTFDIGPDPLNPYKVKIYTGPTADNMNQFLDEAYYGAPGVFGYYNGAAPWPGATRDETESYKPQTPPQVTAAQTNENIFAIVAVCLGYGYDFQKVHWSDLADGVEPKRTPATVAEHGVTIITPDDPQWPYPDPWIEMNNIIFTGFLVRGPKLEHHRNKIVTIAVDICGPHDGSDRAFTQALPATQFLLNEHCLKNAGSGYQNDTYGTLETYANGDAMIKTSSVVACQNQTITWLGTTFGYLASIWIDDLDTTWRDVVKKICNTWGLRMFENRFGQLDFFFIDTVPDTTVGRYFRERIEIKRFESNRLFHELVVNRYLASYYWDLDAHDYRVNEEPFNHAISQAAHVPGGTTGVTDPRGVREKTRECAFTNDAATFNDVMNRELVRRQRRPREMTRVVPLLGLDYDISYRGQFTDSKGLGPDGDVEIPIVIVKHAIRPLESEVSLTFKDLRSIWTGAATVLGDETPTATAEQIGDEEAVPPTAPEIR